MKKVLIITIFSLFIYQCLFAEEMSELERAYKEQYINWVSEAEILNILISRYKTYLTEVSALEREENTVILKSKQREISKTAAINERLIINQKLLATHKEALAQINKLKGEQMSDISLIYVRKDLEISQKRLKEIEDKKQELKIKILEHNNNLPSWWINHE